MLFLGIDLGWVNGASGLASLEFRESTLFLRSLELGITHEDVLAWIHAEVGDSPAMTAIDAPTIIRNPSGQRVKRS